MTAFSDLIDTDPKFQSFVVALEKAQTKYDEVSDRARTHFEYCIERSVPIAPDDEPRRAFIDVVIAKIVLAEYVMEGLK